MSDWKTEEEAACRYLMKKGFRISDRNFSLRIGEIDIVAEKGDLLVFCEVKSRSSADYGKPFEAVTRFKRERLRRVAEAYLAIRKPSFKDVRFDVISIENGFIEHIENAF